MDFPCRFPLKARFRRGVCVAAFVLSAAGASSAETYLVDSLDALKSAIKAALPGDMIALKNGVYTTTGGIIVDRRGAAGQPIYIAAETVGGVEIGGTHGFNVVEPAAHVVISGFTFTHASGKNMIGAGTSQVRFTRNTFQCVGDGPYLSVSGDNARVDHNEFRDKKTAGGMIAVGGTGSQVARHLWIHHNFFHDFSSLGANGAEMIRFGLAAFGLSTGAGLVEHNLFLRCRGESELISNRSSGNVFRYNTLLDSPGAQLTLRHGNDCAVYGNVFRNTGGLRVFGDRHQVFSNYLEGNYIGINLGNGSGEVSEGAPPNSHDRPDNCVIAFNTLVDNRTHYQMSRRATDARGATNTTFANNLLEGGAVAAKIEGPNPGAVWHGNILWSNGTAGDLPLEAFTAEDPLLAPDAAGIKRPQPGSPALDAATGSFPNVTVDLDGQSRAEKKSKGADEIGAGSVGAKFLSASDVGPNAQAPGAPAPAAPGAPGAPVAPVAPGAAADAATPVPSAAPAAPAEPSAPVAPVTPAEPSAPTPEPAVP